MRLFGKMLEYAMVTALALGLVYYGLSPVVQRVGNSIKHSADLIANPASAAQD